MTGGLDLNDRFDDFAERDAGYLESLLHEAAPSAPSEVAGFVWDGLSIGVPAPIDRFVEKFQKVFVQDDARGVVRGWNQRMIQNGRPAPWKQALLLGKPVSYGHYVVTQAGAHPRYDDYRNALVIDYPSGGNRWFDPLGRVVDYVATIRADAEGEPDLLLGRMYLDLGLRVVPTPSYFLLARGEQVTDVLTPPRG
jgi:hypothetical protein